MSEQELPRESGLSGWRLDRLEMANWGTFGDGRVHQLRPEGGWSLLVGENGSGKSTAIDALRTLLVPRTILRGSFNDAAGGQKKRDRSLTSYIRGQWSASRDEDETKAQFLRDEDTPTNLLAVFRNDATDAQLTIAQILWVSGGSEHTVYLVAPREKSIVPDLQEAGTGREMKRILRERGFIPYDSYSGYARDFHQKMNIPGEGAMEVFNQAIGVKEVESVKHFLRNHLLAPGQAVDAIRDRVIPQFASLEDCWNSILRDKERIRLLDPIVRARTAENEAAEKKRQLDALLVLASNYYGHRHWELLDRHIASGQIELREITAKLEEAEEKTKRAEDHERHCQRKLDGHGDSARIRELENEIKAQELDLQKVRETRQSYDATVAMCALGGEALNERDFSMTRQAAEVRHSEYLGEKEKISAKADQAGINRQEAENHLKETITQLKELQDRRVLIDLDLQRIRDWVCQEEGLSRDELPFAGELVEVKPEREDWHGAIERLMHGFGVSLLVPERRYRLVAGLINRTRMRDHRGRGLRIQFYRVPETDVELPPPSDPDTVAGCLNHRENHPFSRWVRGEVSRQFHHRCCRDVAEMEGVKYGLTREGLIRGGTRHVKDDRTAVNDRTGWVLGWSPEKKIQALVEQKEELEYKTTEFRSEESRLRSEVENLRVRIQMLDDLRKVRSFTEIDLTGGLNKLESLREEKEKLEQRSADRLQLEKDLIKAKVAVTTLRGQEKDWFQSKTLLENRLKDEGDKKRRIKAQLPPNPDMPDEGGIAYFAEIERDMECTLETIGELERRASDTLRNRSSQQQRVINEARSNMGAPMQKFLQEFPEDSKDLLPNADYADDYMRIHTRVTRDDLPSHEERFRRFLNDNLTQNIASLDASLAQEVKTHRLRIAQVNAALKELEYSLDSYVEIDVREKGEQAVIVFKKQLREILGLGMQLDSEARFGLFEKIRELITELKKPDHAKLVADSRNWLDFGVRECRRANGAEIDYFDSSQGKSGGQKAKLAFTILAASLCGQYGLAEHSETVDGFRLVVIDEIFARTDEANSRLALDLFRSMGFQLILAAPWEAKVKIAELYVDNYHLAVNPGHNASTIRRASREAYEQAKASGT